MEFMQRLALAAQSGEGIASARMVPDASCRVHVGGHSFQGTTSYVACQGCAWGVVAAVIPFGMCC